jgi:ketosteroid isomerase-like protein
MHDQSSLETRIRRLEDQAEIRQLVSRYCFVIDDRDLAGIGDCFTADGRFRSADGVMDAQGREAIVEQYHGRFAELGPGVHVTHDHVVDLDYDDPHRATGLVSCSAELVRHGKAMLVALRYYDEYRRDEDRRWRFADRLLRFFYYLDAADYAQVLPDPLRNRAYEKPAPADFPESLESWQNYAAEHPLAVTTES